MEKYKKPEQTPDNQLDTFEMAPKKWQDFFITFKKIRGDVLGKIFKMNEQRKNYFLKKLEEKESKSKSSVADLQKYLVYHMSIGGSTGPIYSPKIDFEGEHSLLKFYQELLEEIESSNE